MAVIHSIMMTSACILIIIMNILCSDNKGPVKYGDVVAIKSPGCRHRYDTNIGDFTSSYTLWLYQVHGGA